LPSCLRLRPASRRVAVSRGRGRSIRGAGVAFSFESVWRPGTGCQQAKELGPPSARPGASTTCSKRPSCSRRPAPAREGAGVSAATTTTRPCARGWRALCQGVGFRPTVSHFASELGLSGHVFSLATTRVESWWRWSAPMGGSGGSRGVLPVRFLRRLPASTGLQPRRARQRVWFAIAASPAAGERCARVAEHRDLRRLACGSFSDPLDRS